MSKRPFVDFYLVLGIEPTATLKEIGRAYLSLARKHHPDSPDAKQGSTSEFKAVVEAYETLSDPKRRREFDLRRKWNASTNEPPRCGPLRADRSTAAAAPVTGVGSINEFAQADVGRRESPGGAPRHVCYLPISPEEARSGGTLTVTLVRQRACDRCPGNECLICGGTGSVTRREPVRIQLPPAVSDGTVLPLACSAVFVCIRIRPYW